MRLYQPDQYVTPSADSITGESPSDRNKTIGWVELGVFAVILIGVVVLHVVVLLHSGGLWRDEANTLNTSMLSSFSAFSDKMRFESYPVLWFLILRGWISLGFGETDLALRVLGLIIGLGIVGSLWLVGRNLEVRFPLVSLVLIALCPTILWGDTLRAYGLGVILILLTMGALWRAIEDPVPRKMLTSLVTAVLSVQCLYHNAFLLFALCVGGAAVGLYRRRWKLVLFPLGVGAVAALSVAPYYTIATKTAAWNVIVKMPMSLSWIIGKFGHAIDPADFFISWLWLFLILSAVVVFIRELCFSSRSPSEDHKEMMLFLLVTMLVGIVSYGTFIRILSYPTQVWYYLPLMAVLAVIVDKMTDVVCKKKTIARYMRVVSIAVVAAFVFAGSWNVAHERKTNIDLIAAKLGSIAEKDDLIVVFPFYCGVTFDRYYKGSTRWVTLPDMDDHAYHRYDLFKDRMMQNEPIRPVVEGMLRTLKEGNRVWLVGGLAFPRQGGTPGTIAPAPHSPYGWSEDAYQRTWSRQAGYALRMHGETLRQVRVPTDGEVNKFENVPLLVVQGWRL